MGVYSVVLGYMVYKSIQCCIGVYGIVQVCVVIYRCGYIFICSTIIIIGMFRQIIIIIYEVPTQTIRNCEAADRPLGITRAPFRAKENIFVRGWVLEGVDVSEQFCQFLFCILRCFCHLRRVKLLQGHSKCLFSTPKLSKRSWSPQPNRQEVI